MEAPEEFIIPEELKIRKSDFVNIHDDPITDQWFMSECQNFLQQAPNHVSITIAACLNEPSGGLDWFKTKFPVHMCPSLMPMLMSDERPDFQILWNLPPADEFSKALSKNSWITYMVIMTHLGWLYIYIGSGTNKDGGCWVRVRHYDEPKWELMSIGIQDLLAEGGEIITVNTLALIDKPEPKFVPKARAWVKFLEARFMIWFWTMRRAASTDPYTHWGQTVQNLRRWPVDFVSWKGLNQNLTNCEGTDDMVDPETVKTRDELRQAQTRQRHARERAARKAAIEKLAPEDKKAAIKREKASSKMKSDTHRAKKKAELEEMAPEDKEAKLEDQRRRSNIATKKFRSKNNELVKAKARAKHAQKNAELEKMAPEDKEAELAQRKAKYKTRYAREMAQLEEMAPEDKEAKLEQRNAKARQNHAKRMAKKAKKTVKK